MLGPSPWRRTGKKGRTSASCLGLSRLERSSGECRVLVPPWGACQASVRCWHGVEGYDQSGLSQSPGSLWIRMWPCRDMAKGLHQGHDQLLVTSAALSFPWQGWAGPEPSLVGLSGK